MQAELNKYFYNDISNIILDYHYKTMFNNSLEKMKDFIRENTFLLDSDIEDSDDDSLEPLHFRNAVFDSHKSRMRKIKRQNTMTEELTDSDDEYGFIEFIGRKKYHYYKGSYYSPEEFAYKLRYPDADDEDGDF